MTENSFCPVCRRNTLLSKDKDKLRPNLARIDCKLCGLYLLCPSDFIKNSIGHDVRHLISGYIRERGNMSHGEPLIIDDRLLKMIASEVQNYDVETKLQKFLLYIAHRTTFPGEYIAINSESELSCAYAVNENELGYYIDFLVNEGLLHVQVPDSRSPLQITPKGWTRIYQLRNKGINSRECFVAMSFDKRYDKLYDAIKTGVKNAGNNYEAHRLDDPQDPDLIDNALIARMKDSRFMIADFSMNNAGVYYESGYMRALGRHVIMTCKKLDKNGCLVDKADEKLHFDVTHYPIIFWSDDNLVEFSEALKYYILAWGI